MTPPAAPDESNAAALHRELVARLQQAGYLPSPRLAAAFQAVPRHYFLPNLPLEEVYQDRAIATKRCNGIPISSASQPAIVAIMLAQLDVQPGERVLEIGAGTGYNAALLAELVGKQGQVVTLDYDTDLVETARERLHHLGYANVRVEQADGFYGFPDAAPYDRLVLTVAAGDLAPAWHEQLQPHGRLLLPLALAGSTQVSVALRRQDPGWTSLSVVPCSFMPLRGDALAPQPTRSLAIAPTLSLWVSGEPLADAAEVQAWLTAPARPLATGLQATQAELDVSLRLWLALRDRRFAELLSESESLPVELAPALAQWAGLGQTGRGLGLTDRQGLAAVLGTPVGEAADGGARYELAVGQFGAPTALAEDLRAQLRQWDECGRPSARGLRLRAYPQPSDRPPQPGATVIDKRWTRLLLDYPQG